MSSAKPEDAAERFIEAIVWGEHVTVWAMLSESGREHVLEAGSRRGLDPLQAQRIRQWTSPHDELDALMQHAEQTSMDAAIVLNWLTLAKDEKTITERRDDQ